MLSSRVSKEEITAILELMVSRQSGLPSEKAMYREKIDAKLRKISQDTGKPVREIDQYIYTIYFIDYYRQIKRRETSHV